MNRDSYWGVWSDTDEAWWECEPRLPYVVWGAAAEMAAIAVNLTRHGQRDLRWRAARIGDDGRPANEADRSAGVSRDYIIVRNEELGTATALLEEALKEAERDATPSDRSDSDDAELQRAKEAFFEDALCVFYGPEHGDFDYDGSYNERAVAAAKRYVRLRDATP